MTTDGNAIDLSVLQETFRLESQENLALLERAALELEEHPSDPELVETMFRSAHTIKGNARVVGADPLAAFMHDFEELLEALREERVEPSRDVTSLVLKVVDASRTMVARAADGETGLEPEDEALRAEVLALVAAAPEGIPSSSEAAGERSPVAPASERRAHAAQAHGGGIRVPVERLNQLMDLVGEIAVARGRLTDMLESGAAHSRESLLESHRESDRVYMDLQELVMKTRMVPLGPLFHEYHRTVRDLAVECGKAVRLSLQGEDVEVDTSVVERLRDPLTHLVRNAVSHGIESWSERMSAGKPPQGAITITASREPGSVVVQVSDDGKGLDRTKIMSRAVEKGLATRDEELADAELFRLVLESGFSTADRVTQLSGRGVGLDVVKRSVEQLRGTFALESRPGEGTTVTLRFPLTLAIIGGFRLSVGPETYVVPLDAVVECVELPAWDRVPGRAFGVTNLRGRPLPFLNLRVLFGLDSAPPEREHLVVVRNGEIEAGLAGDWLLGEAQVVIKPVGHLFRDIAGLAGTAILGNGRVAFVLDVPGLLEHAAHLEKELARRQEVVAFGQLSERNL